MPRVRSILLAVIAALGAAMTPAAAEPFTILIYETPRDLQLRSDTGPDGQAYWAAYAAFATTPQQSGAIRGGAPLAVPPTRGARDLKLGGYFEIDAPTLAAARTLAAQAPAARRGGRVDVRAHYPAPTMRP